MDVDQGQKGCESGMSRDKHLSMLAVQWDGVMRGQPATQMIVTKSIHKTTSSADSAMMLNDEDMNVVRRPKLKSMFAGVMQKKLFVKRRHTDTTVTDNKPIVNDLSFSDVMQWDDDSLETMLLDKTGLQLFRDFLRSEFSDENLDFWIAVEDFKRLKPSEVPSVAQKIYTDFVAPQSTREINMDFRTRMRTLANLKSPSKTIFDDAQRKVLALMQKDSYPRFLLSESYQRKLRGHKSCAL